MNRERERETLLDDFLVSRHFIQMIYLLMDPQSIHDIETKELSCGKHNVPIIGLYFIIMILSFDSMSGHILMGPMLWPWILTTWIDND